MAPSLLKLSAAALAYTTGVAAAKSYLLAESYDSTNFFDKFDFFESNFNTGNYNDVDPTSGYVNYRNRSDAQKLGLIATQGSEVYIGVDHATKATAAKGRSSVRIESKAQYNGGLFIAKFTHLPKPVCGTWPAFWMYGPDWPNHGEIDIYENWNQPASNAITLHTGPASKVGSCKLSQSDFTDHMTTSNCDNSAAGQYANQGCGVDETSGQWGKSNGGIYATEWSSEAINVWSWSIAKAPSDIESNPDPTGWGKPHFKLSNKHCNIDAAFANHKLVLNIDFCGVAGDPAFWSKCAAPTKSLTCQSYVANNPNAFQDVFWKVSHINVFQKGELPVTTSSAEPTVITTTAEEYPTTTAAEEYPTTTAEEEYPTTTAEEEYPTTTAAEEYPTTTAAEEYPTTTAAEEYPTTTAAEEYPTTTAAEEYPTTTAEEEYPTTTAETSAYPTETETDCDDEYPTTTAAEYPTTTAAEEYPTTTADEYPTTTAEASAYPTETESDCEDEYPTTTADSYPTTTADEYPITTADEYPTTTAEASAYPTETESDCEDEDYPTETSASAPETEAPTGYPTSTADSYPTETETECDDDSYPTDTSASAPETGVPTGYPASSTEDSYPTETSTCDEEAYPTGTAAPTGYPASSSDNSYPTDTTTSCDEEGYPIETSASVPESAAPTYPAGWTTSTVYQTTTYTITSCKPEVTDCPGRIGQVTTEVIPAYTTVCPIEEATTTTYTTTLLTTTKTLPNPGYPASSYEAETVVPQPTTPTYGGSVPTYAGCEGADCSSSAVSTASPQGTSYPGSECTGDDCNVIVSGGVKAGVSFGLVALGAVFALAL